MSVDRIYLQRSARNIEESPSYVPYSKVRIIVGEEEDGTQLVYEAGDDSFRTLEITNPYGTQAIANSILAKIQGYSYKPYTADEAILNPAAELGDAVNVGDVYSFISSMDTTFSALMSATISAPEDSNIDHEYPFETSEHKEIARKINGVRTSFTVELGRIASEIEETYETKTAAGQQYTQLQSSIEQTAQSITATVAATYETKTAATQMEQRLNSTITQTANSITSTVSATYETKSDASAKLNTAKNYADTQDNAKAATITAAYRSEIAQTADSIKATVAASESKYAVPSGVSIAVYGYGAPSNSIAPTYNGRYYLDQSSGYYYKSNGTSWVRQNSTPLKLITDNLSSSITQTADSIRSEVRASYQSKADAGDDYNTLYSFIEQRADSIKATVAASESKYAVPSGVSIAVYGYGAPSNSIAPTYNGRYYLDQSSGYYYKSNGTSWVRQNSTPLKLITDNLSSSITQTADSIRSEVRASYQSKADADDDYNTLYSFIEQRADSITLSVSSSSNGRTTFTLKDGSTTLDSEALYLNVRSANVVGTITADEVAARATIEAPNIYGGKFYNVDGDSYLQITDDLKFYGGGTYGTALFSVIDEYSSATIDFYNHPILRYSDATNRVYALGTWDFSGATVIMPS